MVLGLCDRFRCLPSQVQEEDVSVLRMLKVLALAEGGGADGGELR